MRAAFDIVCRQLHNEGLGTMTKRSGFLTLEEEDLLWKNGAMGIDTPKQLLRVVVFYNGKNFALRGGDEHRQLKWSQLTRCSKVLDGKETVVSYTVPVCGKRFEE